MARSRNIKPGFFLNEDLVGLPFSTRLLFIGLWTLADREGRLKDRPKTIKMAIFPADEVDVEEALSDLHDTGLISRYVIENERVIQITNFVKHQKPHRNETASALPDQDGVRPMDEASQPKDEALASSSLNDERGKRKDECRTSVRKAPSDKPHLLPENFSLTAEMEQYAKDRGLGCRTAEIFDEFTEFWRHIATKNNKRTERGWIATWQKRIRTLAETSPPVVTSAATYDPFKYHPRPDVIPLDTDA